MTQFFRKIHLSLYLKGFEKVTKGFTVSEGVGDWTELQHIDPHFYGHNSVSFLFFWAAQPGVLGAQPLRDMFLIPASSLLLQQLNQGLRAPSVGCWLSLLHLISHWLTSCLHLGYIIVRHPPSFGVTNRTH